jgi:hypothetical protein
MDDDLTDRLLSAWDQARPDLEIGTYQVTARLSRVGAHLARRQEEVFGRFGLNRARSACLAPCASQ